MTAGKNLPRIGALPAAALAAFMWGACGPMVMQAPFSGRPDTMDPGDLLGGFDGLVVDSESERPIPEALVQATWAFERGIGLVGPSGEQTVVTQTNPDGRYEIPRLATFPVGASARVARFTLIVYRRGYVAWRSDQLFPSPGARRDFSQRRNRVRLVQWKEGWSHAAHLRFMGGGGTIKTAAAWERQAAASELIPAAARVEGTVTPAGSNLLDASPLLQEADVRALNKYTEPLSQGRLVDLPRSEFYDSVHFQSKEKDERFDVAVRLWRLGAAAGLEQYRKLLKDVPTPQTSVGIADVSAEVLSNDVRAVVFLVSEPGVVVSVTCGLGHCTDEATMVSLAKLVHSRLAGLEKQAGTADSISDPFAPAASPPTLETP